MNRNITAVILLVLSVGIYFTVTRGIIADAEAVKSVNDQYSSAIANAEQLVKVRDQVNTDYNNISDADRARLDKMIPDTVDNIRLIIDLNSIAVRHGFSLKDIKAEAAADQSNPSSAGPASAPPVLAAPASPDAVPSITAPTLDTVTVSFDVSAPYEQFISFLQDLEASLRIMDVTHLTVTANDTGTYDFSVELNTYWLRQ
jgi:Tfp pilus assembly protein PilO